MREIGFDHFLRGTDEELRDEAEHQQENRAENYTRRKQAIFPEGMFGMGAIGTAQNIADRLDQAAHRPQADQPADP